MQSIPHGTTDKRVKIVCTYASMNWVWEVHIRMRSTLRLIIPTTYAKQSMWWQQEITM